MLFLNGFELTQLTGDSLSLNPKALRGASGAWWSAKLKLVGAMSSFGSSNRPFDDDGYIGYDPRLQSQRFDSFSNFDDNSVNDSAGDSSPIFGSPSHTAGEDFFSSQPVPEAPSPPSIYSAAGAYAPFLPEQNGKDLDGNIGASNGPILPPPMDMEPEEGFALREWRR